MAVSVFSNLIRIQYLFYVYLLLRQLFLQVPFVFLPMISILIVHLMPLSRYSARARTSRCNVRVAQPKARGDGAFSTYLCLSVACICNCIWIAVSTRVHPTLLRVEVRRRRQCPDCVRLEYLRWLRLFTQHAIRTHAIRQSSIQLEQLIKVLLGVGVPLLGLVHIRLLERIGASRTCLRPTQTTLPRTRTVLAAHQQLRLIDALLTMCSCSTRGHHLLLITLPFSPYATCSCRRCCSCCAHSACCRTRTRHL